VQNSGSEATASLARSLREQQLKRTDARLNYNVGICWLPASRITGSLFAVDGS